jgi:prolyl-tRNA editing enzyme YbaK/EbsC (Cys-tRNA(Pro) deacylase)
MPSAEGNLAWLPATDHPELLAPSVVAALAERATLDPATDIRVARIDPSLADTAAFCAAYDVDPAASANCVIVEGRRGESVTHAAVMVLATDRADINRVVRRHLGARRISFADQRLAQELTGMQQGGITPIGLPSDWPVLVDEAVARAGRVVIGAGARGAKLLVDGAVLTRLPGAEVVALTIPRED